MNQETPPESARQDTPPAPAGSALWGWLRHLYSLRAQLIVPYVLLTLITAAVGLYVVTRLVTSSVRERFVNQLYEASRVAADGVVRREEAHLRILRLMAFTEGVPEAVAARDADRLTDLLLPVALNEGVESVVVVDEAGIEVLGLTRAPEEATFERTSGSNFASLDFVRRTLAGEADEAGDKFVGLVETSAGTFLYTSAPVRSEDGAIAGALLVGTRLQSLAVDLKSQALADVVLADAEGRLLASTLPPPEAGEGSLLPEEAAPAQAAIREFRLYGRPYQAVYSPWVVRRQVFGTLGVILPSNFVVSSEATSRNLFSLLFSLATVAVIALGYLLAQNIARPILRLRTMAQAVAAGDLEQASGFRRLDEIGDLARAFDIMTARLQERTAEARRLYAEAVERNRQLQEMYERLKAAQHQLIQSEKLAAVGQLAAGIVHDVKNPLGVIKGMAEELMEEAGDAPEVVSGLQVIRDNATRANNIVSDLLKFARQSEPRMERRDLRETVEGSLRLTSYLLRKGRVKVETHLPDRAVVIRYDPQQIEQVLINLIQNAVQAMPRGGRLSVALEKANGTAVVRVSDTGEGIPEELLPRIFEPFFTTKPEGQGTGMGLSVTYGIITRHGGTIEVESKVGEGTTFVIRLPEEPPEETPAVEEAQEA